MNKVMRAKELQILMREFPVGKTLMLGNAKMYVMGYHGVDKLLLADRNPNDNYEAAMRSVWTYESHMFRTKH